MRYLLTTFLCILLQFLLFSQSDSIKCTNDYSHFLVRRSVDSISYKQTKINIEALREQLSIQYKSGTIDLDSIRSVFTEQLVSTLFPYWYGTDWAFEGHTSEPNNGEIACGYLVSTTLRDIGIPFNRYRLAQKAATIGMKYIDSTSAPKIFSLKDFLVNPKIFNDQLCPGLYQVGMDFHVGFLYITSTQCYFIHSSFGTPFGVVCELANNSEVFKMSNHFWIANITHNDWLMEKWMNQQFILIPRENR